jgi:hypothetical protein
MRKAIYFCMIVLAVVMSVSCKEKKQDNIIIIRKPLAAKQTRPQRIGDQVKEREIYWVGANYRVVVSTKADTSLPLATDGSSKYYDNRITIRILRADGTEFFNRSFTKADFRPYVDETYYDNGALVGIVFDKVVGNTLQFAASVGSPDRSSDEFMPLTLTITNLGAVAIEKSASDDE